MNGDELDGIPAQEQYELHAPPAYQFTMDRRMFFKILGSGIAVTFSVSNSLAGGSLSDNVAPDDQLSAWIHIGENGIITLYTGKAEVGQNIRTSLAQIVAEELHVSIDTISMVMGDTALTPYDRGTFGSRSIPYMGPQVRKAAATAREVLINMAAAQWKVSRDVLFLADGSVRNKTSGEAVQLGALTKGKALLERVNDNVRVTPVHDWKIAGTSVAKVNGEAFLTGKHKYASDLKLPGMLYGKILRPPAYGATLLSVNLAEVKQMRNVRVVHDGDFIGVAAPDLYTASKALKLIKAEWKTTLQPSRNTLVEHLKENAKGGNDRSNGATSDTSKTFANADVKIIAAFTVDYIAHAPLEPRAGLAQWTGNKLTVWTGTQCPFGVQEDLAAAFNLPKENIRVIQPDTGSGYGGKHTGEAGIEAARLAMEAQKPVSLVWTREEEFTWAYFRPAGVIEVNASTNNKGILTSWEFHNYNSGGSGIDTPYEVSNKAIRFHPSDSPLRQGSYRGLAATANVFAREAVMDDLAQELNIDPLTFRLQNLRDERMLGVLDAAANAFGWWTATKKAGHGFGIGCGNEKGSYVATCAEISADPSNGAVKVVRVVVAFECGAIINPAHLENQVLGAVIQGLGGALFEYIDFNDGKILNPSFSRYRVPRFGDIPVVEVVLLNRKDIPSAGAGETPIVGVAPAIRNAILNATGKKLYTLPLIPKGIAE